MTRIVPQARRVFQPVNETVDSLRRAPRSPLTVEQISACIRTVGRRVRPETADKIAQTVWHRYCAPDPKSYREIAELIGDGVTPQRTRRWAERGLEYVSRGLMPRQLKRGSRLDRALREGRVL